MAAKPQSTASSSDAALAARLQAEEDAAVAQQLEDERIALAHDPWQQAEAEWNAVERRQQAASGERTAKQIAEREAEAQRLRAQQEAEDRRLAEQMAAEGTPAKAKGKK